MLCLGPILGTDSVKVRIRTSKRAPSKNVVLFPSSPSQQLKCASPLNSTPPKSAQEVNVVPIKSASAENVAQRNFTSPMNLVFYKSSQSQATLQIKRHMLRCVRIAFLFTVYVYIQWTSVLHFINMQLLPSGTSSWTYLEVMFRVTRCCSLAFELRFLQIACD